MADYIKPSIRAKPNHFILHVRTNYLNSKRPPDEIVKTIIDLASELKSEKSDVSISSIIMRVEREAKSTIIWKKCVTGRIFFSHWLLRKDQSKSSEKL